MKMKWIKQAVALLLCFFVLSSVSISVFAQTGVFDSDIVGKIADPVAPDNVCDECGTSDIHTEACSLYVAPISGDEAESDKTAVAPSSRDLFIKWEAVNQIGYFTGDIVTLYSNPAIFPDDTLDITKGIDMPESFTVLYSLSLTDDEGNTGLWYMLDTENWNHEGWNTDNSVYGYVKAADVTFDLPEEHPEYTEIFGVLGDCEITISGNIPSTVELEISNVEINPSDFGIENMDTIISSFDLKLMDGETEWQPADGEKVRITLDAMALGFSDGMPVNISQEHDGAVYLLGEFTVANGKLTFITPGFSIFVVTGLWGSSTPMGDVDELTMYVGETIYLHDDTNHTHNWQAQNNNGIITTAAYSKPDGSENARSYCMVTANSTGTVRLSCGTNDSVTITVIEQPEESYIVKIDDQIFMNGCLVPELFDDTLSDVTYKWYKNANLDGTGDYTEVAGEAISSAYAIYGGINVAVDHGGKCWYKVEAYNAQGDLIGTSDPHWVPYSNELENGSFETPQIDDYNPFTGWQNGNVQFNQEDSRFVTTAENVINGTALWWRTTGYGSINNAPGRDIEIVKPSLAPGGIGQTGYYVTPADLLQYAELNCETIGTLYQDVLTAPNTTLTWSFSHRGREGTDTMAVVVMPANMADEYAARLAGATTTSQINAILDEIEGISGAQVWDNLTAGNRAWTTHSGTYTTVEGQYLSRFFFVSVSSASGNRTMGNFIDGVSFDDKLTYTINYYLDGVWQDSETEKVKPYTIVTASKTGDYSEYALDKVVKGLNGVEDPNWGSTSMRVEATGTYLDLYYVTTGISITKKVVIDNSDGSMTAGEVEAAQQYIWGSFGTAIFDLIDSSGKTVATAEVSINGETGEGVAMFVDSSGKEFIPTRNQTYTIVETSSHEMAGYIWTQSQDVVVTFVNTSSLAASAEYTNSYKTAYANLTITKEGSQSIDENQCFIFTVEGMGIKLDVVINGNGSVTIKDLPIGEYTVTENTDWSWRYTPDNNDHTIVLKAGGENTITYNNERSEIYWLSGDSYCENLWNGENAIVVKPKEDD